MAATTGRVNEVNTTADAVAGYIGRAMHVKGFVHGARGAGGKFLLQLSFSRCVYDEIVGMRFGSLLERISRERVSDGGDKHGP